MSKTKLHLFERFGVEIEYVIVKTGDLSVLPIADSIIHAVAGDYRNEVECGDAAWSNELGLHVIELKTNGPAKNLNGLSRLFHEQVRRINGILEPGQGCLLGTGTHPFMDPATETKLWPHENNPIYEAYNRIFDCRGHGWANLQSVHLNLPFSGDDEFGRLHAAIRLVLPLIPALAASTPVLDGVTTGFLASRLEVYRNNQTKIPSIAGRVIPEPVFTQRDYEDKILGKIYRDIRPYDPENILQYEWLNSRGVIPRFERNTLEIRIIDTQECPAADMAISAVLVETLKCLVAERWCSYAQQSAWPEHYPADLLCATIRDADAAVIDNPDYLQVFGYNRECSCTAGELWRHIIDSVMPVLQRADPQWQEPLSVVLTQGPLSRRILKALNNDFSRPALISVYGRLARCLADNTVFNAHSGR
ncbi:MAG: glutamate-cysteine ligase family protein [Candidatus Omnitrophica bacterium]|nr:glutamate-cysteine ligase family protein [Candidatus Omnitrophota bacterium]